MVAQFALLWFCADFGTFGYMKTFSLNIESDCNLGLFASCLSPVVFQCVALTVFLLSLIRKIHGCLQESKYILFSHHGKQERKTRRLLKWRVVVALLIWGIKVLLAAQFMYLKQLKYGTSKLAFLINFFKKKKLYLISEF